jgi:hypothetical protein
MKNKNLYYFLSWTWGLPLNLIGHFVASVLLLLGYKPHKWGGCHYFIVGENWGGVSIGSIVIVAKNHNESTLNHEFGHSIQNCFFGFLCPFVVSIPSAVRYWYRNIVVKFGIKKQSELPSYHSIWFEKQASELGEENIKYWR